MNKKTIVFDFDGVIHKGYKGWKDGSIYGTIDMDLIEYIIELMSTFNIVISSNRPAKQITEFMNKLDLGVEFEIFNKDFQDNMYWNKQGIIGVTNDKAIGILYIDDRGFRYDNLEDLKLFISGMNKDGRYE